MSQPLLDHGRLGRDGPQHCRVLGELEPTVRLHVAYGDISVVRLGDAVAERLERLDGLLNAGTSLVAPSSPRQTNRVRTPFGHPLRS